MANIFSSLESFTPDYVTADGSLVAATEMYQAMSEAEAAAESLSAILDDYATVREAIKASRTNDRCAAFEALMTPQLKAYASMEEAKDTRTFWTKVKEFFIRLWHSVQDFFAKFSVFASAMKSKLDRLNIKDIYDAVSKNVNELEYAKIKLVMKEAKDSYPALVFQGASANDDGQKLSEYAKNLKEDLKEFRTAKQENEFVLDAATAEKIRVALSKRLAAIIQSRANVVNGFKQAVDEVKGGNNIDADTNKKLRINALKDARHAQLMALLAISKQVIKDAKTFIAGVKKVKKKKAA